jgi:hypothetical protein
LSNARFSTYAGESARRERCHEVFSKASSDRRILQVASTGGAKDRM